LPFPFATILFGFSGRISRSQFWLAYAIQIAITALGFVAVLYGSANQNIAVLAAAIVLFIPAMWIGICAMAQRYHDRNKSAWWILIGLIPVIGGIWQLIELGLLKGSEGSNDYGPDPCHSLNVAEDIAALQRQAGQKQPGPAVFLRPRPAAVSQSRSPYTDGRPVFGRRV
jgi:uncharacterized membrane protein YhaH (DUF805 family)